MNDRKAGSKWPCLVYWIRFKASNKHCDTNLETQPGRCGNMSSICHPSKIEFAILLIVQYHYIWWSSPFQAVNPKAMVSYINLKFQNLQRKSRLHFPVLHNAGGCAMLTYETLTFGGIEKTCNMWESALHSHKATHSQ